MRKQTHPNKTKGLIFISKKNASLSYPIPHEDDVASEYDFLPTFSPDTKAIFTSYASFCFLEKYANSDAGKEKSILNTALGKNAADHVKSRTEKRLKHTLKRIKDKGYFGRNVGDILNICRKLDDQTDARMWLLYQSITSLCESPYWESFPTTEETWFMGIECAMQSRHPEVFADPSAMFAPYIDSDIETIYSYVIMLSVIKEQEDMITELAAEMDSLGYFDYETEDPCRQESGPDPTVLNSLRQETSNLKSSLSAEKRAHDKSILRLEHEIEKVKKSAAKEIEALKEQNAQLLEFILNKDAPDEPTETSETPDRISAQITYDHPLPDSRVLFLGGHRNLVKKIETIHPNWLYLSDDKIRTRGASNFDVVFSGPGTPATRCSRKSSQTFPIFHPLYTLQQPILTAWSGRCYPAITL